LHYLTIEDIFIRVGTRVLARLHNPVEIIHSLAGVVFGKTDGVRPPFRVFVCDACSLTGEWIEIAIFGADDGLHLLLQIPGSCLCCGLFRSLQREKPY
jgi:hypothetical protein